MYQIYGLVAIIVLLWGITIWASIQDEEEDRRFANLELPKLNSGLNLQEALI